MTIGQKQRLEDTISEFKRRIGEDPDQDQDGALGKGDILLKMLRD